MDFSIEDLRALKELNETDNEVPHIVSPTNEDSVLNESIDEKGYDEF